MEINDFDDISPNLVNAATADLRHESFNEAEVAAGDADDGGDDPTVGVEVSDWES